jgi:hypothetical protein
LRIKAALSEENNLQLGTIAARTSYEAANKRSLVDTIAPFRSSENPAAGMNNQAHQHASGTYQQAAYHSSQENNSVENPEPSSAEMVPKYRCYYCAEEIASPLVFCFGCEEAFCLYHWSEERKHDPQFPRSALHYQVDLSIHDWVQSTFNSDIESAEQHKLHCEDLGSLWFGLDIGNESTSSKFINTDVYGDLIASSTYPDKAQQFPSLVSFVGITGTGKSTLIVRTFQS